MAPHSARVDGQLASTWLRYDRSYPGWIEVKRDIACALESAFKGCSQTVDLTCTSTGGSTFKFNSAKMTMNEDIPLQRLFTGGWCIEQQYHFWDDTAQTWKKFDDKGGTVVNMHFIDCIALGKTKTTVYLSDLRFAAYDICLTSMIMCNRDTQRLYPISVKCTMSCDDNTVALSINDDGSVPPVFICPITCAPMKHPVVAGDGHTYESEAIKKAMLVKAVSPMTNKPLPHTHLVTNHNLRIDMLNWIQSSSQRVVSS
jgi:hypothetical protein